MTDKLISDGKKQGKSLKKTTQKRKSGSKKKITKNINKRIAY